MDREREDQKPTPRRSQRPKKSVDWGGIFLPNRKRVKTEPGAVEEKNVPGAGMSEKPTKTVSASDPPNILMVENASSQEILLTHEGQEVFPNLDTSDMALTNKNPFLITPDFPGMDVDELETAEVLSESTLSAEETADHEFQPTPADRDSQAIFLDHSYALNAQNLLKRSDEDDLTKRNVDVQNYSALHVYRALLDHSYTSVTPLALIEALKLKHDYVCAFNLADVPADTSFAPILPQMEVYGNIPPMEQPAGRVKTPGKRRKSRPLPVDALRIVEEGPCTCPLCLPVPLFVTGAPANATPFVKSTATNRKKVKTVAKTVKLPPPKATVKKKLAGIIRKDPVVSPSKRAKAQPAKEASRAKPEKPSGKLNSQKKKKRRRNTTGWPTPLKKFPLRKIAKEQANKRSLKKKTLKVKFSKTPLNLQTRTSNKKKASDSSGKFLSIEEAVKTRRRMLSDKSSPAKAQESAKDQKRNGKSVLKRLKELPQKLNNRIGVARSAKSKIQPPKASRTSCQPSVKRSRKTDEAGSSETASASEKEDAKTDKPKDSGASPVVRRRLSRRVSERLTSVFLDKFKARVGLSKPSVPPKGKPAKTLKILESDRDADSESEAGSSKPRQKVEHKKTKRRGYLWTRKKNNPVKISKQDANPANLNDSIKIEDDEADQPEEEQLMDMIDLSIVKVEDFQLDDDYFDSRPGPSSRKYSGVDSTPSFYNTRSSGRNTDRSSHSGTNSQGGKPRSRAHEVDSLRTGESWRPCDEDGDMVTIKVEREDAVDEECCSPSYDQCDCLCEDEGPPAASGQVVMAEESTFAEGGMGFPYITSCVGSSEYMVKREVVSPSLSLSDALSSDEEDAVLTGRGSDESSNSHANVEGLRETWDSDGIISVSTPCVTIGSETAGGDSVNSGESHRSNLGLAETRLAEPASETDRPDDREHEAVISDIEAVPPQREASVDVQNHESSCPRSSAEPQSRKSESHFGCAENLSSLVSNEHPESVGRSCSHNLFKSADLGNSCSSNIVNSRGSFLQTETPAEPGNAICDTPELPAEGTDPVANGSSDVGDKKLASSPKKAKSRGSNLEHPLTPFSLAEDQMYRAAIEKQVPEAICRNNVQICYMMTVDRASEFIPIESIRRRVNSKGRTDEYAEPKTCPALRLDSGIPTRSDGSRRPNLNSEDILNWASDIDDGLTSDRVKRNCIPASGAVALKATGFGVDQGQKTKAPSKPDEPGQSPRHSVDKSGVQNGPDADVDSYEPWFDVLSCSDEVLLTDVRREPNSSGNGPSLENSGIQNPTDTVNSSQSLHRDMKNPQESTSSEFPKNPNDCMFSGNSEINRQRELMKASYSSKAIKSNGQITNSSQPDSPERDAINVRKLKSHDSWLEAETVVRTNVDRLGAVEIVDSHLEVRTGCRQNQVTGCSPEIPSSSRFDASPERSNGFESDPTVENTELDEHLESKMSRFKNDDGADNVKRKSIVTRPENRSPFSSEAENVSIGSTSYVIRNQGKHRSDLRDFKIRSPRGPTGSDVLNGLQGDCRTEIDTEDPPLSPEPQDYRALPATPRCKRTELTQVPSLQPSVNPDAEDAEDSPSLPANPQVENLDRTDSDVEMERRRGNLRLLRQRRRARFWKVYCDLLRKRKKSSGLFSLKKKKHSVDPSTALELPEPARAPAVKSEPNSPRGSWCAKQQGRSSSCNSKGRTNPGTQPLQRPEMTHSTVQFPNQKYPSNKCRIRVKKFALIEPNSVEPLDGQETESAIGGKFAVKIEKRGIDEPANDRIKDLPTRRKRSSFNDVSETSGFENTSGGNSTSDYFPPLTKRSSLHAPKAEKPSSAAKGNLWETIGIDNAKINRGKPWTGNSCGIVKNESEKDDAQTKSLKNNSDVAASQNLSTVLQNAINNLKISSSKIERDLLEAKRIAKQMESSLTNDHKELAKHVAALYCQTIEGNGRQSSHRRVYSGDEEAEKRCNVIDTEPAECRTIETNDSVLWPNAPMLYHGRTGSLFEAEYWAGSTAQREKVQNRKKLLKRDSSPRQHRKSKSPPLKGTSQSCSDVIVVSDEETSPPGRQSHQTWKITSSEDPLGVGELKGNNSYWAIGMMPRNPLPQPANGRRARNCFVVPYLPGEDAQFGSRPRRRFRRIGQAVQSVNRSISADKRNTVSVNGNSPPGLLKVGDVSRTYSRDRPNILKRGPLSITSLHCPEESERKRARRCHFSAYPLGGAVPTKEKSDELSKCRRKISCSYVVHTGEAYLTQTTPQLEPRGRIVRSLWKTAHELTNRDVHGTGYLLENETSAIQAIPDSSSLNATSASPPGASDIVSSPYHLAPGTIDVAGAWDAFDETSNSGQETLLNDEELPPPEEEAQAEYDYTDASVDWLCVPYNPPPRIVYLHKIVRKRFWGFRPLKHCRHLKSGRPAIPALQMAAMAIENSRDKFASLDEIVQFILKYFPYFRVVENTQRRWIYYLKRDLRECDLIKTIYLGKEAYYKFAKPLKTSADPVIVERDCVDADDESGVEENISPDVQPESELNPLVPICSYSDEEASQFSLFDQEGGQPVVDHSGGGQFKIVGDSSDASSGGQTGPAKRYDCFYCKAGFGNLQDAYGHALSHPQALKRCPACDFTTPDQIQFAMHVNLH